jgi:hypothetical protein
MGKEEPAEAEFEFNRDKKKCGEKLHDRVAHRNRNLASPTTSPKDEITQHRDVLIPMKFDLTMGTVTSGKSDRLLLRQSHDHDIEKTTYDQTQCDADEILKEN